MCYVQNQCHLCGHFAYVCNILPKKAALQLQ